MTDPGSISTAAEQRADKLLKQTFHRPEQLTGDFENRVMSAIRLQARRSRKHRAVFAIMMAYWLAASLAGSWLLFETSFGGMPQSSLGLGVILVIVALVGTGIYLLVRQSDFKLSDLFLGTVR